jgi:hypothetical protein
LPRQVLLKKYLAATAGINTKKNPSTTSNTTSEYAQKIPKRALSREENTSGNDGLFPKEIPLDSQSASKQGSNPDASNYHSTFWGDKKPENRVGVCGVVGSRRSLRGNGTSSSSRNVKESYDNYEDGDVNDPQNPGVYTSAAAIADAAAAQKWVDEWSREISYTFKSDDLWDGKRGDSADSDSVSVTCGGLKRGSRRGRIECEGISTADERDNQRGISLESRGSIGSRSRTPDRPGSSGSVRRGDVHGGNDRQGGKNGSADSYGSFEGGGERGSVSRGRGERRHSEGAGGRVGAGLGGGLGVGTGVGMGMEQEDVGLRAEAADRHRQQRAQQLSEGLPAMTVAALSRLIMLR